MRGKVNGGPQLGAGHRITPAYAGKSTGGTHAHKCARDHPRVCGEKPLKSKVQVLQEGSPPRMRGKGAVKIKAQLQAGITPAYAGKSLFLTRRGFSKWDHPRVCGEKRFHLAHGLSVPGSPPRMRGKDIDPVKAVSGSRITPAYAGKSACAGKTNVPSRDHPRVCGEKNL